MSALLKLLKYICVLWCTDWALRAKKEEAVRRRSDDPIMVALPLVAIWSRNGKPPTYCLYHKSYISCMALCHWGKSGQETGSHRLIWRPQEEENFSPPYSSSASPTTSASYLSQMLVTKNHELKRKKFHFHIIRHAWFWFESTPCERKEKVRLETLCSQFSSLETN